MKYLIKFATRSRVNEYRAAKASIFENASPHADFKIITSIDHDQEDLYCHPHVMQGSAVNIGPHTTKVDAINRAVPLAGWDVLINFSDDMRFTVKNWDVKLWALIASKWGASLDFFAHLNDGFIGYKLPTMSIMGREYYERFFYIYPPCYKSFSCDAEAMFVAMMLGKHHYFEDVLFHHIHPVNTRKKYDALNLYNDKYMKEDTDTFHRRMKENFYINGAKMDTALAQFDLLKLKYDQAKV